MAGKIYTKKGDKGQTKTMHGAMSKGDQLAIALGTIDELNSWIGLCRSTIFNFQFSILNESSIKQFINLQTELQRIQNNLLIIGSGLAGSGKKLGVAETSHLEKVIDKLTADLPELTNFIFPTGLGAASYLQLARTVARRAEREVVRAITNDQETSSNQNPKSKTQNPKQTLKYLNRLSDALFTFGRWVNWRLGGKDEVWK